MPRITTITASYSRKFWSPQTGSAEASASFTGELSPGEDYQEEYQKLQAQARELVKAEMLPFLVKSRARLDEVFNFLPAELQDSIIGALERAREGE